jgi:hypothetical protein
LTARPVFHIVVKAVAGLAPVKRNQFIALDSAVKSVNRELEAKARTLAGIRATSPTSPPARTERR